MKKPKVLWIIAVALITVNLIIYLGKPGGEIVLLYTSNILPVLCSIIATFFILSAVRSFKSFDFTKIAWMFILLGLILYVIAESIYGIVEIYFPELKDNFPGIADIFWSLGYIPIFIGMVMMFTGYKKSGLPMGKPSLYIAISSLIFIIAILTIYFLLVPIIKDDKTATVAKVFYMFYPIADLLIVIPAAILIYITSLFGSAVITKPWKFLTFGFVLFTISDLFYAYLDWEGLYGNGNLIDLGWNIGYLLIAMAGLNQYLMVKSLN
jgi:hypothetical protein